MANEIELKLAVNTQSAEQIINEIQTLNVIEKSSFELKNTYFESEDGWFNHHKMGLRIREQNGQFTQTIKMVGTTLNGVHTRPEYDVNLQTPNLDLSKFEAGIFTPYFLNDKPLNQANSNHKISDTAQNDHDVPNAKKAAQPQKGYHDLNALQAKTTALFSTDFHRQLWLVELENGAKIEIVFDNGLAKAGQKTSPICEFELEIKHGNVEDLKRLAKPWLEFENVNLSDISKAQKGYELVKQNKEGK